MKKQTKTQSSNSALNQSLLGDGDEDRSRIPATPSAQTTRTQVVVETLVTTAVGVVNNNPDTVRTLAGVSNLMRGLGLLSRDQRATVSAVGGVNVTSEKASDAYRKQP